MFECSDQMFTFIAMSEINKFQISEDGSSIKWSFNNQLVELKFQNRIFQAVLVKNKQQILVITDIKDSGRDNIFFYDAQGYLFVRPELSNSPEKIIGAYAIWYIEDQEEQTLILLPEYRKDHDIKCSFNLNTFMCHDFSITR